MNLVESLAPTRESFIPSSQRCRALPPRGVRLRVHRARQSRAPLNVYSGRFRPLSSSVSEPGMSLRRPIPPSPFGPCFHVDMTAATAPASRVEVTMRVPSLVLRLAPQPSSAAGEGVRLGPRTPVRTRLVPAIPSLKKATDPYV